MFVADLSHEQGVSWPTAYKWIKRHDQVAPDGLLYLKRTPHGSQYAASPQIENVALAVRKRSLLGARKLKALPEILLSILLLFLLLPPLQTEEIFRC